MTTKPRNLNRSCTDDDDSLVPPSSNTPPSLPGMSSRRGPTSPRGPTREPKSCRRPNTMNLPHATHSGGLGMDLSISLSLDLGTGFIGTQTLEIVAENPDKFRVVALAAGSNVTLLLDQLRLKRNRWWMNLKRLYLV